MTEENKWLITDFVAAVGVLLLICLYADNKWNTKQIEHIKIHCVATAEITPETVKKLHQQRLDCIPKELYVEKDIAKWVHQLKDAYCINYRDIKFRKDNDNFYSYLQYKKLRLTVYGSRIVETKPYVPITEDEEKLIFYIFKDLQKKYSDEIRNSINLD